MSMLPRLALATPNTGPEPSPAALAMLAGLTRRRVRVQHFRSRACLTTTGAVGQITGLPGRHLDAWLMPPPVARTVFARGAARADLALVEGTWDDRTEVSLDCDSYDRPGPLGPIAEALDLPRVAVVRLPGLGGLHLPHVPAAADAILIDGLERPEDFEALSRLIRLVLRKPVVGAVEALPGVRAALRDAPRDRPVPEELFDRLAESFLRFADLEALRALALSRPFPAPAEEGPPPPDGRRFRVAFAQDEAFGGYFPDTLETLEALGAELVEFSPLRDEALPEAADLVMIGCGCPDRHAEDLARNLSLMMALRGHVCRGRRIYSEGGGTAYLGRSLIVDGRTFPVAGILPFDAELRADMTPPMPVSRTLSRESWLGPCGTTVRGYRSGRWTLHPAPEPGDCPARSGVLTDDGDILFHHHAVGSLIHLHLAALPDVVRAFAGPHRPSLSLPSRS